MLLKIDFLKFQSRLKFVRVGERTLVFDPIRKKEIVATPEEILRQMILHYLLEEKNCPAGLIRVEKGVKMNGMTKRADILIHDKNGDPWLLVECKSPKVAVNQDVFDQTARYNLALKVPFLAVTNGVITYCCSMDYVENSWQFLDDWPGF